MENRLSKIEEAAKRSEYMRIKSNKLRQIAKDLDSQPAGRKNADTNHAVTTEEIPTTKPDTDPLLLTGSSFASSWAQELEEQEKREGGRCCKAGQTVGTCQTEGASETTEIQIGSRRQSD